jgi:hypothetical protein
MKRNIDLTENMIFSRPNRNHIGINLRHLEKSLGRTLHLWNPDDWVQGEQKDSLIDRKLQIIPLGDREERMFIKECLEADSGEYCDCCGISLLKHPWTRRYGLCERCSVELKNSTGHSKDRPWHNK